MLAFLVSTGHACVLGVHCCGHLFNWQQGRGRGPRDSETVTGDALAEDMRALRDADINLPYSEFREFITQANPPLFQTPSV